jgi:hypothetical protein
MKSVKEAIKTGNKSLLQRIVAVLPSNVLLVPTGDSSRPYSRLAEFFLDDEGEWDFECVDILLKSDRLEKEVLDENKNTIFH